MVPQIQLSDFVGEHGSYQLFLSLVLFVRYVFLGLMANSGPLMTPDVTFYCQLPTEEVLALMPNISLLNQTEQDLEMKEEFKRICQLDLHLYQQAYLNQSSTSVSAAVNRHKQKFQLNSTARYRQCTDFTYETAPDQGRTMTSEFDLVCERDWLRSIFQSSLSVAIVIAHVFWGTFSDKYGRFKAQRLCLVVSLIAGSFSIFATDFWTFLMARALCTFGDLGLVVSMTTTLVELVGNQYRGISVAVVNFGYALGVSILPYIVAYCEDFRLVIAFTVLCHIITIPFILSSGESVRWQITNGKFDSAQKELKRILRWNKSSYWSLKVFGQQQVEKVQSDAEDIRAFEMIFNKFINQIESQQGNSDGECAGVVVDPQIMAALPVERHRSIRALSLSSAVTPTNFEMSTSLPQRAISCDQINSRANSSSYKFDYEEQQTVKQAHCINLVASQLSFVTRVSRLFRDKKLMITVFTIVWTTFNSELQYTSYIIINLEVGEDVYLNYILGGCMEALAAISASLLLSYAPRRHSLIIFWLIISFACFGLSVAHIDSTWAVWLLALAKFSQSSLSSIASVAAYESFPTFLRQSGSGLVFTLGMLGSVFAPLIFAEFDDHDGMDRVLMTFSLSSLSASILIYLFLKETRNCELK